MVDKVYPSKDPASESKFAGVFATIFRKQMENIDGQLPAVVVSYDSDSNTAEVLPLIPRLATSGEAVPRAKIARVPVLCLGGGGYMLHFPLQAGDKGWIEASDRDISLFMQAGQTQAIPNTVEIHNFSSGRFVPDIFGKYELGSDSGALVLGALDGSVKIALDETSVRVTHPVKVELLTPIVSIPSVANIATVNVTNLNIGGKPYNNHYHLDPVSGNTSNVRNP